MKNKSKSLYSLSDATLDIMLENPASINSYQGKSESEWIQSLESRLASQRKEFLALLDHAAENPSLMPLCAELRQEMQQIKARLADLRFLLVRNN